MELREMDEGQPSAVQQVMDALINMPPGDARRLRMPIRFEVGRVSKLAAAVPAAMQAQMPPGAVAHRIVRCEAVLETERDVGDLLRMMRTGEVKFTQPLALQLFLVLLAVVGTVPAPGAIAGAAGRTP